MSDPRPLAAMLASLREWAFTPHVTLGFSSRQLEVQAALDALEAANKERDELVESFAREQAERVVATIEESNLRAKRDRLAEAGNAVYVQLIGVLEATDEFNSNSMVRATEGWRSALAGGGHEGGLIHQPTNREMGVDAPDFGPVLGGGHEEPAASHWRCAPGCRADSDAGLHKPECVPPLVGQTAQEEGA